MGHDRKNVSTLVHSFLTTFKNKKVQPALILKTSIVAPSITNVHEIQKRVDMIREQVGGSKLPNIYILDGDLTDSEMNSLYNHPKVKASRFIYKG